jgi:hypothetical protein
MTQTFSYTGIQSSANFILTNKLPPLIGTQSSRQIHHDMTNLAHLLGLKSNPTQQTHNKLIQILNDNFGNKTIILKYQIFRNFTFNIVPISCLASLNKTFFSNIKNKEFKETGHGNKKGVSQID